MAPYKSQKQRGLFHILEQEGKLSASKVKEYDKSSKGAQVYLDLAVEIMELNKSWERILVDNTSQIEQVPVA